MYLPRFHAHAGRSSERRTVPRLRVGLGDVNVEFVYVLHAGYSDLTNERLDELVEKFKILVSFPPTFATLATSFSS